MLQKKRYEPPSIVSYSSDDVLKELGPANACSPFWGAPPPPDVPGYAPGLPPSFYKPPEKKKKEW